LRNGAGTGGTGSQILYCNRIVYVFGTDSQWYRWSGGWTPVGTIDPCASPAPPAPVVNTVTPNSGPPVGGTSITISGSNFQTNATVSLGGSFASSVSVVNSSTITALTPGHAAGMVDVVVTNPGGPSGTLTNGFVYALDPAPSVGSITPNSGSTSGGTSVTINGSAFVSGATVNIGGVAATGVSVVNSTTITATTPAHAAGTVNVVVTNPDGQNGTLTNGFTYNAPPGGETVLLADDFNDGVIDTSKWTANNLFSGFSDATVGLQETTTFNIGPLKQNIDGSHYNGIRSSNGFDFRNAYSYVELVQGPSTSTKADAMFTVGRDAQNYYRVYVEEGIFICQARIAGTKRNLFTTAYNAVIHRYWRIRHELATGNVVFETAPDNGGLPGVWTLLYSEQWNNASVPVASVMFEIKGGTWQPESSAPGIVIFDNFKVARP